MARQARQGAVWPGKARAWLGQVRPGAAGKAMGEGGRPLSPSPRGNRNVVGCNVLAQLGLGLGGTVKPWRRPWRLPLARADFRRSDRLRRCRTSLRGHRPAGDLIWATRLAYRTAAVMARAADPAAASRCAGAARSRFVAATSTPTAHGLFSFARGRSSSMRGPWPKRPCSGKAGPRARYHGRDRRDGSREVPDATNSK